MDYYVMSPLVEGVTALISAPSTEKARTTFLDYLERTGYIRRSQRQSYRHKIIAEKVDDPTGMGATVELSYDFSGSVVALPGGSIDQPEGAPYEGYSQEIQSQPSPGPQVPGPSTQGSSGFAGTPIGQASINSVLGG